MRQPIQYTARERFWLCALGACGLIGGNGLFFYGLLARPAALSEALFNPVAAAIIIEAVVLVPVFAYLFARWGVSRLGWKWFIVLSLLGTMAFAIPVVLLFPRRSSEQD